MPKFLLRLAIFALLVSLTACTGGKKKKPASSSHLYEGDGPTIHFNDERETAGGAFNPS